MFVPDFTSLWTAKGSLEKFTGAILQNDLFWKATK
jgi:phosphopantetheinyl transferase